MNKHTPGPWKIVPYGDGDSLVIHDGDNDNRICFMATSGSSPNAWPKIQANARLIAAAPDMLEALKLILPLAKGYAAQHAMPINERCVLQAVSAIAKAEGRP